MQIIKQVEPVYNVAKAGHRGYKTFKKLEDDFGELAAPIEEDTLWGKTKAVAGKAKKVGDVVEHLQVEAQVANKIIKNVPGAVKGLSKVVKYVTGTSVDLTGGVDFVEQLVEKNKDELAVRGLVGRVVNVGKSVGSTTFGRIRRVANNLGFSIKKKAQLLKGKAKNTVQNLLGEDGDLYFLLKKRMFKIVDGEVVEVEPGEMDRFLRLDALTKVARMNVKKKSSYEDKDGNVYQFNKDNKLIKIYDSVLDRFVHIEVIGEYPELLSLNKRMGELAEEFGALDEKFGNFSTEGLSSWEAGDTESVVRNLIEKMIEPTGDVKNSLLKEFVKSALEAGVEPKRIEELLKAEDSSKIKLTGKENAIYNFFRARETGDEVVVDNAKRILEEVYKIPIDTLTKDKTAFTKFTDIVSLLSQTTTNLNNYSASLRSDMGILGMYDTGMLIGQVANTLAGIPLSQWIAMGFGSFALFLLSKAAGFTGKTLWSLVRAGTKAILGKNKVKKVKKDEKIYKDFVKYGECQLKKEQEQLKREEAPYLKEDYEFFLESGVSKEKAIETAQEMYRRRKKIEEEMEMEEVEKEKELERKLFEMHQLDEAYKPLHHNKRQKEDEVEEEIEEIEEKDQKVKEILKKTKKKEEFPQFFPNPFTNNPKIVNLDVPESFETRRIKSGKKYSRKQPVISKALVTASSKEIQMAKPTYTLAQAYAQLKKAKKPETKRKWREIIRHLQSLESNSRLYGYDQPIFNEDQSKYVAAAPPAIIIEEPDAAPVRSSVVIEDDVVMAGPPSLHTAPTILLPPAPSSSHSSSENSDSSAIVLYSNSQLNEPAPEPPVNEVPPSEMFAVTVPTRVQCFQCGQPGHYATQCPNRGSRKTSKRKASSNLKKTLEKKESIKNILKSTGKPISRASSNTFRINSKKKPKKSRRNRSYCHCGGCCNKCCGCC